jgi:hypothetical protein
VLPPASYCELAAALRARLEIIADQRAREADPAAHLVRLQAASEEIVRRQGQLPPPVDPRLAHYLARCSYDKALEFLEAGMANAQT